MTMESKTSQNSCDVERNTDTQLWFRAPLDKPKQLGIISIESPWTLMNRDNMCDLTDTLKTPANQHVMLLVTQT